MANFVQILTEVLTPSRIIRYDFIQICGEQLTYALSLCFNLWASYKAQDMYLIVMVACLNKVMFDSILSASFCAA